MQLTDLYEGILETFGFEYDKATGAVSIASVAGLNPVMIDTKQGERRLVIPYHEVLRNPDWNTYVAFHPISENVARTDSEILKFVQRFGTASINYSIDVVMESLVTWCADKDSHSNLNHKQNVFLSLFPNADDKAVKSWKKISDKIGDNNVFVKVATLRNKELEGQSYLRVASVKFPFYKQLVDILENDDEPVVFGVKLRKKDVEGFKSLFEFIFKHVSTPDAYYSFGSRSNTAPSFHAFINAYVKVYKDILRVANLLKFKDFAQLKWADAVVDVNPYRGQIPALPGNDGDVTEADKLNQTLTVNAPAQAQNPMLPAQQAPVVQPQVQQPQAAPQQVPPAMVTQTPNQGHRNNVLPTQAEQQAMLQKQQAQMMPQQPVYRQPVYAQPQMMQPVQQPMMQQPQMMQPQMMNNPFAQNPNLLPPGQQPQMQMVQQPQVNTLFTAPPQMNPYANMYGNPYANMGMQQPMMNPQLVQNTMNYGRLR